MQVKPRTFDWSLFHLILSFPGDAWSKEMIWLRGRDGKRSEHRYVRKGRELIWSSIICCSCTRIICSPHRISIITHCIPFDSEICFPRVCFTPWIIRKRRVKGMEAKIRSRYTSKSINESKEETILRHKRNNCWTKFEAQVLERNKTSLINICQQKEIKWGEQIMISMTNRLTHMLPVTSKSPKTKRSAEACYRIFTSANFEASISVILLIDPRIWFQQQEGKQFISSH